jgi:hypothetical protein
VRASLQLASLLLSCLPSTPHTPLLDGKRSGTLHAHSENLQVELIRSKKVPDFWGSQVLKIIKFSKLASKINCLFLSRHFIAQIFTAPDWKKSIHLAY